ncbi:hypothetical protein SELMODRAFT_451021 [Selaginella moellendorffii]|uniref:Late embryogenesis abundant protein LEA-2 subgroup domain-containing protein n=1 Tax=Selaginella moellendorffii TaxID=88036 RepID=D8QPC0_SELML|nr:uncharacterized protein LOC9633238 [Selaginella moellendorffii]EFJ37596.1 hypothetical protein SELMODRAFT_451021 [Selaginella moellendorffii]|eukprot:XP_002960057.1 uncharacterized protein LOC9633238 [Selaginella moellendorffii]
MAAAAAQVLVSSLVLMMVAAAAATYSYPDQPTDYILLSRLYRRGPERAQCIGRNRKCRLMVLQCPWQCPDRKSTVQGKQSCFIDCSPKCEATCKRRKPNCRGYGSVCYDPRFVGGDGVMFYFHGMSDKDFAIVSDSSMQINAHFIGKRVQGRSRDFTWVQALGVMFGEDSRSLTVGAKKVGVWDDEVDQLVFTYKGEPVVVPAGANSVWTSDSGDVRVERIAETNSVELAVEGLLSASITVVPITERDNKIHKYELTRDDCFAHLDIQFKFFNLSSAVDGVLGQTYRPEFHNPVKVGVPMPIMGGEDRFQVSSLISADCKSCVFQAQAQAQAAASSTITDMGLGMEVATQCSSNSGSGGMMCRR